jgi:hypothetical protein
MAVDDHDVTINHVALHSAAVQSNALALFSGFLGGASQGDGNDDDAHSPPDKFEDGLFGDMYVVALRYCNSSKLMRFSAEMG